MNSRQVRSEFNKRCKQFPIYKNDKPAKEMAFVCFVDDLKRSGKISEKVAFNVTLS